MGFKNIVILIGVVGLTACSRAPKMYEEAAVRFAEEDCKGVLAGWKYKKNTTEDDVVNHRVFYYSCIEDTGTKQYGVKFTDIPVKYFKEGETL